MENKISPESDNKIELSSTTQYLSAAAHLSKDFRNKIISYTNESFKAKAPEIGINREIITEHCQNAIKQKFIRNIALFLILLITFATSNLYYIFTHPDEMEFIIESSASHIVISLIFSFCVVLLDAAISLKKAHHARTESHGERESSISCQDNSNVVVYGGFSPFVGSGVDIGGWSIAVNLDSASSRLGERSSPQEFKVDELYNSIKLDFNSMQIDGIKITDKIFIDGRSIRNNRHFLPDIYSRPLSHVDPSVVEHYINNSGNLARHYLCVEVSAWKGEYVVSMFVRLKKHKSSLFIENSNFLLPPLLKDFYKIDEHIPDNRIYNISTVLGTTIVSTPFLLALSPLFAATPILQRIVNSRSASQGRRLITRNAIYNYGATTSIREIGSGSEWRVYFQKLDREMHTKIIQQKILDKIVDFLDKKGIDTSSLKERSSFIVNQGLIISGGAINADSLAVGTGSRANTTLGQTNSNKPA